MPGVPIADTLGRGPWAVGLVALSVARRRRRPPIPPASATTAVTAVVAAVDRAVLVLVVVEPAQWWEAGPFPFLPPLGPGLLGHRCGCPCVGEAIGLRR
ncbi:hypothetical protein [Rhodococcus sp. ARP2]|uniref:hypothetical protein n=1 Tax=Rhodococcus sp. ARP2 TaxID=1661385 RepID=UPI001CB97BED|nr:hypothetical protein [Rhodococcus sp. ARP2]